MYKYWLSERLSTHSFDNYQISVIKILDRQKKLHHGIGVCPIPSLGNMNSAPTEYIDEQLLIIKDQQARSLCDFIEKVVGGSLPERIDVLTSEPTLKINLKGFTENWHGGGGYKGTVSFDTVMNPVLSLNVTIAKSSLTSMRNNLIFLYQMENMAVIKA